jgi:hypothetical protein
VLVSLSEEDRRSLLHHPEWKGMMGNLLDTLVQVGRREEALAYLVAFGAASCDVMPVSGGDSPARDPALAGADRAT